MSKKQTTPNTPELTPIEATFLECAKSGKPVLLHEKDTIRRKALVLKIHKQNGGLDAEMEYFFKGKLSTEKDIEAIYAQCRKNDDVDEMRYLLGLLEFKRKCSQSTKRTLNYIDLGGEDGNEIYQRLVNDTKELQEEARELDDENRPFLLFSGDDKNSIVCEKKGYLFKRNGTVFVDNLHCNTGDEIHYRKLANIIKNGYFLNQTNTFNWLIIYIHALGNLPPYFREQFEKISLESKRQDIPETPDTASVPQTPAGATVNKRDVKLVRGIKLPYADKEEFKKFLSIIKTKYKDISLEKIARIAEGEMKTRKLFLDGKGEPIYKRSTLKKMLYAIKNHHKK